MKRYGKDYELTQNLMDTIAVYMDDEIREKVHFELAPCTGANKIILSQQKEK